jgi:predicted enzyme related to lactoylglutathione lyase
MAAMGAVSTIVLLTGDMDGMTAFYHGVLGFDINSLVSSADYVELDGDGVAIGITHAGQSLPAGRSMAIGIDVEDLDHAVKRVEAAGVAIIGRRDGPYVSVRSFRDPDGNVVSLLGRHV